MTNHIRNLFINNGVYFYAKGGITPPGLSFIKAVDEAIFNLLGLKSPNSCCNPSNPTNGQVPSWNATTKTLEWVTVAGGGLGTNITLTPNPTGIVINSSTGTGQAIGLATTLNAGLLSPAQLTLLNSLSVNPGNSLYYGTNAAGVKGFYALPTAGSASNLQLGTNTATTQEITNSNGTGFILQPATISVAGLLSATDKTKLNNITATTPINLDTLATTLTGKQAGIQFKDENVALGTVGTVDEIDFTGTAITATRVGNKVTVNVAATSGVTNLGYTASPTTGTVTNSAGTTSIIPLSDATNSGLQRPGEGTTVNNLVTLSGVAAGSTNNGTFTGTTIPDNQTTKQSLQALETAVELKQNIITVQEEGVATGTPNPTILNFVGGATASQTGSVVTVTVPTASAGTPWYDAGNGAMVKASAPGVTFVRNSSTIWTFTIPAGVELYAHNIYSTIGITNLTLNYNYASNAITNQDFITANPPSYAVFNMSLGSNQQVVIGGTATSAFRPSINASSGGNIQMFITMGSGIGVNESLIKGIFQ
jgi:hypothetical protein